MKDIKKIFNIKKKQEHNFTLGEVIIIVFAFSVLTSVIAGYTVYMINDHNLILDKNLVDIVDSYNKIVNDYYGTVDKEKLANSAIGGMMNELHEQYSIYMNSEDTENLNNKLDGSYEGIGIQVRKHDNKIVIMYVYDNTPAATVGLQANDILIKIDDYSIKEEDSLEEAVALIKDKEKITLTILRGDQELTFELEVKTLDNPVVDYKKLGIDDKTIGYIYLSSFSSSAKEQFTNALKNLEAEGINSLILDLRSNTGGYLNETTEIASMFIKKGHPLLAIENNDGKTIVYDETDEQRKYDIVVLVDSATASASEILASALKESYGAIIVGTQTYGKGKVQQTSVLSDQTMIKYTTANWYTPKGNSLDGVGLTPGVYVELTPEYVENPCDETDSQLQKALSLLNK